MQKNKYLLTGLALVLCLANLFFSTGPLVLAQAEENPRRKTEVVYASLSNAGQVDEVYVVNQFENAGKTSFMDHGDYQSVKSLSGSPDSLKQTGDSISVDASKFAGSRIWYQGNLGPADMPWQIDVTYQLDGKELKAEDLAGAEGKLSISLTVKPNSKVDSVYADHYALQISLAFRPDLTDNIESDQAIMAIAGNSILANFMVLPKTEEAKFHLTADVKNFEMDPIRLSATPLAMDFQLPDLNSFFDPLTELEGGIGQIAQAGDTLAKQDSALSGGLDRVHQGAREMDQAGQALGQAGDKLGQGLSEYLAGVDEYIAAGSQFSSGSDQLLTGGQQIAEGLKELSARGGQLNQASKQIAGAFDPIINQLAVGQALQEMEQGLADVEATQAANQFDALYAGAETIGQQLANLTSGLAEMQTGLSGLGEIIGQSLAGLADLPEQAPPSMSRQNWLDRFGLQEGQLTPTEEQMVAALVDQSAVINQQTNSLLALKAGLTQAQQIIDRVQPADGQTGFPALAAGAGQLSEGYQAFLAGLQDFRQLAASMDQLTANLVQVRGGLSQLRQGMGQLSAGMREFRDKYQAFDQGLDQYLHSVGLLSGAMSSDQDGRQSFIGGLAGLNQGLRQFAGAGSQVLAGGRQWQGGFDQYRSGVADYSRGAGQLTGGIEKYRDGFRQYLDGVGQLSQGTKLLAEKTRGMSDKAKAEIAEQIDEFMADDFDLKSFVSSKNDPNISNVQFVMLTKGINKPAEQGQTEDMAEKTAKGFWERFLDLFR